MHTGYDSFWMYQNNRHEPVLHLPKNDNHSCAVLADNYKQVQNGGPPNHFNNYIQPQNNISSSQQNYQPRTTGPQHIWPSTVYSRPLKTSYLSQYHSQEAFSTQFNNLSYPSQIQQNYGVNHIKNPNKSVSQVYNSNNSGSHNNLGITRGNENSQSMRLRVKDVSSLCNITVPSSIQNQFLNNVLCQTQQQQQQRQHQHQQKQQYGPNYGAVNYNKSNNSGAQNECVSYGKVSVPQANPITSYYGPRRTEPQQFLQNSASFYQQPTEFSNGRQLYFGNSRPTETNLHAEASKTNTPASVLDKGYNYGNNQDAEVRVSSCDALLRNRSSNITPKRNLSPLMFSMLNNKIAYSNSLDVNKRLTQETSNLCKNTQIQSQQQENMTGIDNACFRNNTSVITRVSSGPTEVTSNVKGPVYRQVGEQENNILKVSTPQNAQTTSLNLYDSNHDCSSLSLPCLLESNDEIFYKRKSPTNKEHTVIHSPLPQTGKPSMSNFQTPSGVNSVRNSYLSPARSLESTCRENVIVPPRKRCPKEPFLDVNKENLQEFLNWTPTKFENTSGFTNSISGSRETNAAKEVIFQNDIALELKEENFHVKPESSDIRDDNISERKVFEVIKKEHNSPVCENSEGLAVEGEEELSEERNTLRDSAVTEVADNSVSEKADVDESSFGSKSAEPKGDNYVHEGENSITTLTHKGNEPRAGNDQGGKGTEQELVAAKINYKSKINRDKLHLLIQFLEKDDDPAGARLNTPIKRKISCINKRKTEMDLNHNRRKLSKTCIVRNKNNSREMISMRSQKIPRVELSRCSSQTPQTLKSDIKSENIGREEETPTKVVPKAGESASAYEKELKSDLMRENQAETDHSTKSEPKNVKGAKESRRISNENSSERNILIQAEWNVISKMRTFQNLERHLCTSCDLVLSIDSFWINVVSGELRCWNCFKKNAVKARENSHKHHPNSTPNAASVT